jgi:hypothetical protein
MSRSRFIIDAGALLALTAVAAQTGTDKAVLKIALNLEYLVSQHSR